MQVNRKKAMALTEILKSAVENTLTKVPPNIRQPYITEDTWKKSRKGTN